MKYKNRHDRFNRFYSISYENSLMFYHKHLCVFVISVVMVFLLSTESSSINPFNPTLIKAVPFLLLLFLVFELYTTTGKNEQLAGISSRSTGK